MGIDGRGQCGGRHCGCAGLTAGRCFTGRCFTGRCFTGRCFTGRCFTGRCFTGRVERSPATLGPTPGESDQRRDREPPSRDNHSTYQLLSWVAESNRFQGFWWEGRRDSLIIAELNAMMYPRDGMPPPMAARNSILRALPPPTSGEPRWASTSEPRVRARAAAIRGANARLLAPHRPPLQRIFGTRGTTTRATTVGDRSPRSIAAGHGGP
jgi:hypothetical protein